MTYFIDIDGTLCTQEEDYAKAQPKQHMIDLVNTIYEQHHVVIWTARGATTGIDWTGLTVAQLNCWGVKYHELRLDKPYFDVLIDDKAVKL